MPDNHGTCQTIMVHANPDTNTDANNDTNPDTNIDADTNINAKT